MKKTFGFSFLFASALLAITACNNTVQETTVPAADKRSATVAPSNADKISGQTSGKITPTPEQPVVSGGTPSTPEETLRREKMLEGTYLPGPMPPPDPSASKPKGQGKDTETVPN